jgi:hypothetical protein
MVIAVASVAMCRCKRSSRVHDAYRLYTVPMGHAKSMTISDAVNRCTPGGAYDATPVVWAGSDVRAISVMIGPLECKGIEGRTHRMIIKFASLMHVIESTNG